MNIISHTVLFLFFLHHLLQLFVHNINTVHIMRTYIQYIYFTIKSIGEYVTVIDYRWGFT